MTAMRTHSWSCIFDHTNLYANHARSAWQIVRECRKQLRGYACFQKKTFPVLAAHAEVCLGLSEKGKIPSPSFLRLSNPSSNFSFSSPKCCTNRALRKFAAVPPLKPPKLLAAVLPSTSSWITRFTCRLSFAVFQALSMLQNVTNKDLNIFQHSTTNLCG